MQKAHRKAELFVMIAYSIGHLIIGFFHEPWFDESLAWLIARDSSLYEILFVAPHFEGHPSLWHLVLMPFAKSGMPFGLSLNIISLLFSGSAITIFILKAPFKRIIRLSIPFTYFVFYQYSIISRPYCMMMLAFMLMAITYRKRDEKPGRFILSLWFLCLTGAYGIVIAGGICFAWILKMFISSCDSSMNKNSDNGEYRSTLRIFWEDYLYKSGKFYWLLMLLIYVLFLLWRVAPAENAYAIVRNGVDENNGILVRGLYSFFGCLADVFLTNIYNTGGTLTTINIPTYELGLGIIVGVASLGILLFFAHKAGKMLEFLIPYMLFGLFGSVVYFSDSHVGIVFLFVIYTFWNIKVEINSKWKYIPVALALCIAMSLYWMVSSCICDIMLDYGYGHNEMEFIKSNGLEECTILAEWNPMYEKNMVIKDYIPDNMVFSVELVGLSAENPNLKIVNNPKALGTSYAHFHSVLTKEEGIEQIEKVAKMGVPDIIVGQADLSKIYGDLVSYNDYKLVYKDSFGNIRKGVPNKAFSYIYIKNSIVEEKNIPVLNYSDRK